MATTKLSDIVFRGGAALTPPLAALCDLAAGRVPETEPAHGRALAVEGAVFLVVDRLAHYAQRFADGWRSLATFSRSHPTIVALLEREGWVGTEPAPTRRPTRTEEEELNRRWAAQHYGRRSSDAWTRYVHESAAGYAAEDAAKLERAREIGSRDRRMRGATR